MPQPARSTAVDTPSIHPESQADGYAPDRPQTHADDGHPTREDIAREAYLIYLANGERDGNHEDDWFAAERRLRDGRSLRQGSATQEQAAAQLDDADAIIRTPG
jgi:hypothetical protein